MNIKPKRVQSLQKQKAKKLETQQLELEAKKLEDQLIVLKTVMQQQKESRDVVQTTTASRWKAASSQTKIKSIHQNDWQDYAQNVLEQKRKNQVAVKPNLPKPILRTSESQQSSRPTSGTRVKLVPLTPKDPLAQLKQMREQDQQQPLEIIPRIRLPLSKLRKIQNIQPKQPIVQYVFETQTESVNMKNCCWQCYKTSNEDFQVQFKRLFCSLECFMAFKEVNVVECKQCWAEVCKGEGYLVNGDWLCSAKCQNAEVMSDQLPSSEAQSYDQAEELEDEVQDEPDLQNQNVESEFNEFLTKSLLGSQNIPPGLADLEKLYRQPK